jgi:uncharacterized protein YecT (DUF1311 family)
VRYGLIVAAATMLCVMPCADATDASWLLVYAGKSTNQFIWDKRADTLINGGLPKGFSDNVRGALGGPPDPVFVADKRYVSLAACFPHWCLNKAFLWVDTKTGAALGAYAEGRDADNGATARGNWRYAMTLGSIDLTANDIPAQATRSLLDWITEHDLPLDSVEFIGRDGAIRKLDASAYAPRARFHPPAGGPSFDCAKASSRTEGDICADATLAKLDLDLAIVYEQERKGLATQPDRDQLRELQRRWLQRRDSQCSTVPDRADCLAEQYRQQREAILNWVPLRAAR